MRSCIPLTAAYARTIHKFQGLSAGPVDFGKIPNPYECIICDPDKNSAEGRALGLLYTAISRATTLGDDDGLNSAIYFIGKDYNENRIRMLGKKKDSSDDFINVVRRSAWVQHIHNNTKQNILSPDKINQIFDFISSTTISYDFLHKRINNYILCKNCTSSSSKTSKTTKPTSAKKRKHG